MIALDAAEMTAKDDERFGTISDLTTANMTSRFIPRAGRVHTKKQSNVLFTDGTVRLLYAFKPINGNLYPTSHTAAMSQLEQWMIRYDANPATGWNRGKTLPF